MKKYLLIIAAGMFVTFTACNNEKKKEDGKTADSKSNTAIEKNLEAVHNINKFFETGDVSLIEKSIAIGAIDHAGPAGDMVANNMDTVKAYFVKMRAGFEMSKMELIKEWADAEYVVQWMKFSGTSKDAATGVPAGQKLENMYDVHISKLKDGKTVEHWEFMQPGDLMKMMGGTQPTK
jgi:predicted ester cyclase